MNSRLFALLVAVISAGTLHAQTGPPRVPVAAGARWDYSTPLGTASVVLGDAERLPSCAAVSSWYVVKGGDRAGEALGLGADGSVWYGTVPDDSPRTVEPYFRLPAEAPPTGSIVDACGRRWKVGGTAPVGAWQARTFEEVNPTGVSRRTLYVVDGVGIVRREEVTAGRAMERSNVLREELNLSNVEGWTMPPAVVWSAADRVVEKMIREGTIGARLARVEWKVADVDSDGDNDGWALVTFEHGSTTSQALYLCTRSGPTWTTATQWVGNGGKRVLELKDATGGTLVSTASVWSARDAECCPSGRATATFRAVGGKITGGK